MKKLTLALLTLLITTTLIYGQDNNQNVFSYGNLVIFDSPNITVENNESSTIYRVKNRDDLEYVLEKDKQIYSGLASFVDQNNNIYRSMSGFRYFPVKIQDGNFFVEVGGFVTSNGTNFVPVGLKLETELVPGTYNYRMNEDVKNTIYYFEK